MGGCEQLVEVVQAPEQRVDIGIIRNVIAKVRPRRPEDRRQPDSVPSKLHQIPQSRPDSARGTHAGVRARPQRPAVTSRGLASRLCTNSTQLLRQSYRITSTAGSWLGITVKSPQPTSGTSLRMRIIRSVQFRSESG